LLGAWGEAAAAEFLRKKHYKIVAAGFRCRMGEIDLVAANRKYLVFVEVKLRKSADFAQAVKLLAQAVKGSYENMDGDFTLDENNQLWKGDVNLSENLDLIDVYVEGTDADVTIFIEKTRRLTTLVSTETNERIIGTDASDAVWEAVQKGETYEATGLTINNLPYTAVYLPLEDSSGQIIGMVFAGQPSTEVDSFINQKLNTFIIISVVMLLIAAAYGLWASTRLAKSIVKAEDAVKALADGQLDVTVDAAVLKRTDEIGDMGQAIADLTVRLGEIIGNVRTSVQTLLEVGDRLDTMAEQSSHATDEISRAVEEISKGAVSQAEEIETASSRIGDMGDRMEKIVQNVGNLTRSAESMNSAEQASSETMQKLDESNERTTQAVGSIGEQIRQTDAAIQEISASTDLITSIASQTNLLSLNASIEAARAGEAGRGFAVVADEISKLAVQSNEAAATIQQIITNLTSKSRQMLNEMQETEGLIHEQQERLADTRERFREVSVGIDDSKEETSQISSSVKACDAARAEVVDVITNLSAISEENAASTQETNASMEELNAMLSMVADEASKLQDISVQLGEQMKFFK